MRLRGKVAMITGGSSGFGRATAVRFGEEGSKVLIADVDEARGKESVSLVEQTGGEAALVVGDIATAEGAEQAVRHTLERFGGLDVLVNNAGIAQDLAPEDTWNVSEEIWDRIIRVNLKSVYLCSKFAIPQLLERGGGAIVNVASIAASCSVGGAAYGATKGGILSYTRQVSRELAARGIRINCVSPGFMRTPMSTGERLGATQEEQEARMKRFARLSPMKRAGAATDIADAIVYLACDESRYVTGQEIVVDGGYLVR
jgi:NAD(P)-dependent dehydrogenase (short-subunit alcohol dehydrogenase family)